MAMNAIAVAIQTNLAKYNAWALAEVAFKLGYDLDVFIPKSDGVTTEVVLCSDSTGQLYFEFVNGEFWFIDRFNSRRICIGSIVLVIAFLAFLETLIELDVPLCVIFESLS